MTVSFQILSSLSFVKNHLSFDGITNDAESVFKSPTIESNTKHHNLTAYPTPLVHMTHSRCRDPISLPQRRVHRIAQFRVNKGGKWRFGPFTWPLVSAFPCNSFRTLFYPLPERIVGSCVREGVVLHPILSCPPPLQNVHVNRTPAWDCLRPHST